MGVVVTSSIAGRRSFGETFIRQRAWARLGAGADCRQHQRCLPSEAWTRSATAAITFRLRSHGDHRRNPTRRRLVLYLHCEPTTRAGDSGTSQGKAAACVLLPYSCEPGDECARILRRPVVLLAAPDLRGTAAGSMDVAATPRHPTSGT